MKECEQLVKKLALIQQQCIRSTFPDIIERLKEEIQTKKKQLKDLPIPITSEMECLAKFNEMTNVYRESIYAKVQGNYKNELMSMIVNGGATVSPRSSTNDTGKNDERISYRLYKFQEKLQEKINICFSNFFTPEYNKLVLAYIEETAGITLPNFPSFQVIERLFTNEDYKLKEPCMNLVKETKEYMTQTLLSLFDRTFVVTNYPALIHRLRDVIVRDTELAEQKCLERVQDTLIMERHIFTLNHYYMNTVNSLKRKYEIDQQQNKANKKTATAPTPVSIGFKEPIPVPQPVPADICSLIDGVQFHFSDVSNESQAAVDIQIAMHAYCKVVKKRVIDQVSQLCYHFFVTNCALLMHITLSNQFKSTDLLVLMAESVEQTQKRNEIKASIKVFEEALNKGLEFL
ncbi:unnamed protein product [Didymodactylos carnosus]|uniref:GED domain-containing protein n=1 Tax=Didymodactylos carnosus TaxID=1234261 RepID=A0A814U004_9BILA|nr:unnamed protein product [Didymodactylos carnosus]CAF3932745.1 unnamed protein product [Didymodactylos carnosus]